MNPIIVTETCRCQRCRATIPERAPAFENADGIRLCTPCSKQELKDRRQQTRPLLFGHP
jgi:hypothetical protein